ncbi:MAG: sigma-54-dependent Fis family transcriptional regulator [Ignavibacteriae bacterium]|nr:sigma-54-dependent Fis family transcriptional regulator [Ignavibacteriota bacterium]MCB9211435.1 sigma-54-dependent Fis family transcriptional regulator [Ignavibacteriales bacterium]MCB9258484.1 sigma-54-dependent Fis family transcriptional regulator [Ignavibacteriales bacterium]
MKILIVDDELEALNSHKRILKREGFENIDLCDSGIEAPEKIKKNNYDIVLLDLIMPEISGLEILENTKPTKSDTEFILITAVDDIQTAVKAVKMGAYDYLIKPVEPERLILAINRAYERKGLLTSLYQSGMNENDDEINPVFKPIVSKSSKVINLFRYTEVMANSGNPIMITGESGTGKELFAKAIHKLWTPNGPFIPVNVASVPESLFESQFFGYNKGAFTGANQTHSGYFRQANNGTLFLDEIGELPLSQQPKLLRVLEEKLVYPIGDNKALPINVKIVSATNIDINIACKEGKFRLDLLYRLKSAHINLPSLNERIEDIPLLTHHFLNLFKVKYNKPDMKISPEAIEVLKMKHYLGNIREFSQIIENAVILSDRNIILPTNLGSDIISEISVKDFNLKTLKENSEDHVIKVLAHTNGDKKSAAKILGLSLRQVQRKISEMKDNSRLREMIDF